MVRTRSGPTEYKFVASKRCPNGELPSDPLTDRHRQTPKLCKKPLSQFIIAPRAQASRRCETQASLSGKAAKLWLAFRSLDLFRALREPDRRRRDEKRPCRSEQKTATNQNDYLTGKAPYKSWAAVRGVYRTSPSPPITTGCCAATHRRLCQRRTPDHEARASTGQTDRGAAAGIGGPRLAQPARKSATSLANSAGFSISGM